MSVHCSKVEALKETNKLIVFLLAVSFIYNALIYILMNHA